MLLFESYITLSNLASVYEHIHAEFNGFNLTRTLYSAFETMLTYRPASTSSQDGPVLFDWNLTHEISQRVFIFYHIFRSGSDIMSR